MPLILLTWAALLNRPWPEARIALLAGATWLNCYALLLDRKESLKSIAIQAWMLAFLPLLNLQLPYASPVAISSIIGTLLFDRWTQLLWMQADIYREDTRGWFTHTWKRLYTPGSIVPADVKGMWELVRYKSRLSAHIVSVNHFNRSFTRMILSTLASVIVWLAIKTLL